MAWKLLLAGAWLAFCIPLLGAINDWIEASLFSLRSWVLTLAVLLLAVPVALLLGLAVADRD